MVKFNLKKKIAKALVFAMVMGTVGIHGAVGTPAEIVHAADPTPPAVKIDYENFTATVEAGNDGTANGTDRYVFLEVLKSNDPNNVKVSATYSYPIVTPSMPWEKAQATIDLSFLKMAKDQYIRVYGDKSTYTGIIPIKHQEKKPTIKYDVAKGILVDKAGTAIPVGTVAANGVAAVPALYSWKSLYGSNWSDLMANSLDGLNIAGTTILVRQNAVAPVAAAEGVEAKEGAPVGVEVKVKIPAIPKAPKVKVDYVKGTVTIPKDSQVAFLKKSDTAAIAETSWSNHAAAKTYDLEKLAETFGLITKLEIPPFTTTDETEVGCILVVRNNATGKPISTSAFINIGPITKLNAPADGKITQGTGENAVDIAEYESTQKGMKLTAKASEIQYSTDSGKKWNSIKATSSKEVKVENGKTVLVRIAGVKGKTEADCKFPSKAVELTCKTAPAKIKLEAKGDTTLESPTADAGAKVTFVVTILDGNGTDVTESYVTAKTSGPTTTYEVDSTVVPSSSNSSIVPVIKGDAKGITVEATVAKGTAAGKSTITVAIGEVKGTIDITVTKTETE